MKWYRISEKELQAIEQDDYPVLICEQIKQRGVLYEDN